MIKKLEWEKKGVIHTCKTIIGDFGIFPFNRGYFFYHAAFDDKSIKLEYESHLDIEQIKRDVESEYVKIIQSVVIENNHE